MPGDQLGLAQHLEVVIVGPVSSKTSVRSHTQALPPSWEAISDSSRSRTGSPIALNNRDSSIACSPDSSLFGVELAKRRPGYTNFAITEPPLKLVLI